MLRADDYLKIYNLETEKIIYERSILEINNGKVKNVLIDDYAYFTLEKDNTITLYVWDYSKETRKNINMVSFDEKEYKFKNNELREEIKNKYNIDVYMYDQAVTYFPNYYVIPATDDILINSRLIILRDVLASMTEEDVMKLSNTKICLEKSIVDAKLGNDCNIITNKKDNNIYMAIDITNDDFKNIFIEKVSN